MLYLGHGEVTWYNKNQRMGKIQMPIVKPSTHEYSLNGLKIQLLISNWSNSGQLNISYNMIKHWPLSSILFLPNQDFISALEISTLLFRDCYCFMFARNMALIHNNWDWVNLKWLFCFSHLGMVYEMYSFISRPHWRLDLARYFILSYGYLSTNVAFHFLYTCAESDLLPAAVLIYFKEETF